jgi:hypothetical protein
MRRPRKFVKAPPKGWITKKTLLADTGVDERVFDGWVEKLGLETCLVSRGKTGITSYYPPKTIRTIQRLSELRVSSRRNIDEWIWQLWLEEHDVDICAWANRHLADGLKRLGRGQSKGYRFIFDRVRSPTDRAALENYAGLAAAGLAGVTAQASTNAEQASIYNAEPPIFDAMLKVAGLPLNARLPGGELRNIESRASTAYLGHVLDAATSEEVAQARRDWQMIAGWIRAAEAVDWSLVAPDIDRKIRTLTGARPDPPSVQARKAQRSRPVLPPGLVQWLLAFGNELAVRAAVLPLLIDLRRSPALSEAISTAAAMIELELEKLPRKSDKTSGAG